MNRSSLARTAAPVAVFAAVLAVLVAIQAGGNDAALRPLPIAAGGGAARDEATTGVAPGRAAMAYGGALVFSGDVTAGLPTEGPVYDLGNDASTARIAALARALGIDGDVRTEEPGWVAGTGDRVLRVARFAGLPWHVDAYGTKGSGSSGSGVAVAAPPPDAPDAPVTNAPDGPDTPVRASTPFPADAPVPVAPKPAPCPTPSGTDKPCEIRPEPPCVSPKEEAADACGGYVVGDPIPPEPPPHPAQPTDAAARAAAQPVLDAAGVTGATTFADGWDAKDVVVTPSVDGLPTVGYETRVSVDVAGTVVRASGMLARPGAATTYPLLDPEAAATRGGAYGGGIYADGREPAPAVDLPCPAPCTAPPVAATPEPRMVSKVRLGLVMAPAFDASAKGFLAPAWLVTVDGAEIPLLALPDRYLATPPPPDKLVPPDVAVLEGEPAGSPGSPPAK
jgi:hypothetical protein